MKKYLNLFIFISFFFVAFALAKIDYLSLPIVRSPTLLLLSLFLICIGFLAEAYVWKVTNRTFGYAIRLRDSISSVGLSVFGKYIPGKVWVIMGRAGYLSAHYPFKTSDFAYIALVSQVLTIWIGLGIALIGIWNLPLLPVYSWIFVLLWLVFSLILIHPAVHRKFSLLMNRITRGNIKLPVLKFREGISLIPVYIGRWILFSASFYFMINALSDISLPWYVATAYPLAGTIGLIAFFVPGGIGIREGIIVFFLTRLGVDIASAVGLSFASRLWFIFGEITIFLLGFAFRRRNPMKSVAG